MEDWEEEEEEEGEKEESRKCMQILLKLYVMGFYELLGILNERKRGRKRERYTHLPI